MKHAILKSRRGETYVDTGVKVLAAVVCGALILGSVFWILKDTVLSNVKTSIANMLNSPDINPMEDVMWEPGVEKVPSTSALWTMNGNTLTGYIGPKSANMHLVVPNEVDGVRVLRIQRAAAGAPTAERYNIFGAVNDSTPMTIELSDGIKEIGDYAFSLCSGITGPLILPSSVRSIGRGAFMQCTGFSGQLDFPDSLKEIGQAAFDRCTGLSGPLVFPAGLQSIGRAAFQACNFTGSLTIPEGITVINDYVFNQCKQLNGKLTLPSKTTSIGMQAFTLCPFTETLELPSTLVSIGKAAFSSCMFTGPLVLPGNLEVIDSGAFQQCKFTGTLTLPKKLKTIGAWAFNYNASFNNTTLEIPASVTEIGPAAFYSFCYNTLESFTVEPGSTSFKSIDGVLYTYDGARLLKVPQKKAGSTLVIPEGVTTIDGNSMDRLANIKTMVLPSTLRYTLELESPYTNLVALHGASFYNCGSVQSFEVAANNPYLTSVDGVIFSKDMKTLCFFPIGKDPGGTYTVPATVTLIAQQAFCYATIKTVYYAKGVTLGPDAFTNSSVQQIVQ